MAEIRRVVEQIRPWPEAASGCSRVSAAAEAAGSLATCSGPLLADRVAEPGEVLFAGDERLDHFGVELRAVVRDDPLAGFRMG